MPTARELLEQADALMRKNRGRSDADFPILTDAVAAAVRAVQDGPGAAIPVLTERVEEVVVDIPKLPQETKPAPPAMAMLEGDPSDWLVMDTIDPALHSVTGKAPDTLAVVPPVTLKTAAEPPSPPTALESTPTRVTLKAAGSAPTPPPAGSDLSSRAEAMATDAGIAAPPATTHAPELPMAGETTEPIAAFSSGAAARQGTVDTELEERWRALAEQISMQVLQRLDLFTDTGLKDQLARHLQPIVDRASAELISEINHQVGKLVRSYIAEAIEREIAQWRSEHS